jgi:ATP-binding cassette subfamily B protein
VVILAASAGLPILSAVLLRAALDAIATGRASLVPIVGLALTGVASWAMGPVRAYLVLELERRTGLRARDRLYEAVGAQPGLSRLEDPGYLNRLSIAEGSGVRAPLEIVVGSAELVQATLLATGFVVALSAVSPVLSVVVLAASAPAVAGQLALSRRRIRLLSETAGATRREVFFGSLLTDVQAALEIRLFGLTGFFRTRMLDERRRTDARRRQVDRRDLAVQAGLGVLAAAIGGAGLVWAASRPGLSVGDVALTVAGIAAVQGALSGCVSAAAQLHTDLGAYEHFRSVLAEAPPPSTGTRICPPLREALEIKDVWFRYTPGGPWVLRGVDLRVDAGSAIGIVGANGAGKSTLVKLLCRMYEPTRGTIAWDGVDIRSFDVDSLRRRMGAVFQSFTSYDLTAAENIGVGDLAAFGDRARIEHAAVLSDVDDAVRRLPNGYDTLLSRLYDEAGSVGAYLSGGQWQRIAVARALMRSHADVLLLDEPSSGLDPEAEGRLNARVREVRAGRTSILISHRLSAMRDADQIVVLDGGEIVERGRHAELDAADGRYATLFRTQAAGYLSA